MNSITNLMQHHMHIKQTEQQIKRLRVQLIEQHKNNSCNLSSNQFIIIWQEYLTLSLKLSDDTIKFNQLLTDSMNTNDNEPITNSSSSSFCKYSIDESMTSIISDDQIASMKQENKEKKKHLYEGNGFDVFTNHRNKNKPIFSSTLLLCTETRDNNKTELTQFMVKYGNFKQAMIENINFKNCENGNYAVIRVRGPLDIIKSNVNTLNDKKDETIMNLFKRRKLNISCIVNRTLKVSNFDILNIETYKHFTELFLKFGDLLSDIKMGLDSNKDPFAIITYRKLEDAKNCYQCNKIVFGENGERILNIEYSNCQFIKSWL